VAVPSGVGRIYMAGGAGGDFSVFYSIHLNIPGGSGLLGVSGKLYQTLLSSLGNNSIISLK
jgi:hypothetical protein